MILHNIDQYIEFPNSDSYANSQEKPTM